MGVFRQCLNMLVPKGRKQRHPDLLAIVIVLLIPIGCSVLSFVRKMQVGNADIIVSGVGVLGGLFLLMQYLFSNCEWHILMQNIDERQKHLVL